MTRAGSVDPMLLDRILDSVTDGVFTVDERFTITYFNRAAETITGYPRAEAVGTPCYEVFRTSLCGKGCPMNESLVAGRTVECQEIAFRDRHGETRTISVSTATLVDDAGGFIGAVETFRDITRLADLEAQLRSDRGPAGIISRNASIRRTLEQLPVMAASDASILIEGRSGTGKGLFARAVHALSARADGPFVHVNMGALPETLLEAELFGHVRGAFTDAKQDRAGRFAAARGGTLFLDEIGDAPLATQVKLLRVLQDKEYEPVGSSRPVRADVRMGMIHRPVWRARTVPPSQMERPRQDR